MRLHTGPGLLDRFLCEVDSAFGQPGLSTYGPAMDVLEYSDRYEVVVDLPGASEKDVEVEFADGVLEIRGSRSADTEGGEARALRRERLDGSFRRVVALGDEIDVEAISARFRDGVLTVTAPKSERARPRQIRVSIN